MLNESTVSCAFVQPLYTTVYNPLLMTVLRMTMREGHEPWLGHVTCH